MRVPGSVFQAEGTACAKALGPTQGISVSVKTMMQIKSLGPGTCVCLCEAGCLMCFLDDWGWRVTHGVTQNLQSLVLVFNEAQIISDGGASGK